MDYSKKFEEYVSRFGFKIYKVAYRPDLLAVKYMNQYLFAIPKKMYGRKHPMHRDMTGLEHPDYYECEQWANAWNSKVKRTDFLKEALEIERERLCL
jgi:hypothetical protein